MSEGAGKENELVSLKKGASETGNPKPRPFGKLNSPINPKPHSLFRRRKSRSTRNMLASRAPGAAPRQRPIAGPRRRSGPLTAARGGGGGINDADAVETAFKACRESTKESSATFYFATMLMAPDQRRKVWAIYSWQGRAPLTHLRGIKLETFTRGWWLIHAFSTLVA